MGKIILKRQNLPPNIVCVGDSITFGQNAGASDGAFGSYPYYLAQDFGLPFDSRVRNLGVTGLGSRDLIDPDFLLSPNNANHLVLMIGVNDISHTSDDPTVILARDVAWVNARKASGWIVSVCTITLIGTGDSGIQARSTSYSSLLRSTFDRIIEHATDPNIGHDAPSPSTYVTSDLVHLTPLGNQLSASQAYAFLSTHIGGGGATVEPSFGPNRSADLTAWYRDWLSTTPQSPLVDNIHNIVAVRAFQSYLGQNNTLEAPPHVTVNRIDNVINGQPAISFPGDAIDTTAWYQSTTTNLASLVTNNNLLVHALINPQSIVQNQSVPYWNEGIFSDVNAVFGLSLKSPSAGVYKAVAYVNDGAVQSVETDISLNAWSVVSVRITGGKLGIRIGSGAWVETTCGSIAALSGSLRVGVGIGINHTFHGYLKELMFRNAWDSTKDTSDLAYFDARYAL